MTVDHDERRRKIAEIAAEVIAREGLEAATIRRISAELGGPTKIVTYYFPDKQELLRFTWQYIAHEYFDRIGACEPTDIVGNLMAMAASDERSITRWRVYAAFWDLAARDPFFADLQRQHINTALTLIGDMIRALDTERTDVEQMSLLLNATVQGISLQTLADLDRWSAERIRGALTDQVAMMLGRRTTGFDEPDR